MDPGHQVLSHRLYDRPTFRLQRGGFGPDAIHTPNAIRKHARPMRPVPCCVPMPIRLIQSESSVFFRLS